TGWPSADTTRQVTVYVPPGRLAGTTTSRRPLTVWILPLSTRLPSTSKIRTAPKATSTASEKTRWTAGGGVLTVVWGDGSVRSSTAWAAAGPAVDTRMASTRTVPARARVTPARGERTARLWQPGLPGTLRGPEEAVPGVLPRTPGPPKRFLRPVSGGRPGPDARGGRSGERPGGRRAGDGGPAGQGRPAEHDEEGAQPGEREDVGARPGQGRDGGHRGDDVLGGRRGGRAARRRGVLRSRRGVLRSRGG